MWVDIACFCCRIVCMQLRSGVSDLGKSYTPFLECRRGERLIHPKQYFTPLVCSETSLAGTAVKQLKAGRLFWLLTCKWADHTLKLCVLHLPSHSLFPARDKLETLAQRGSIIIPFLVPQSNTFPCSESDWKHWPGGEKCSISSPDSSRDCDPDNTEITGFLMVSRNYPVVLMGMQAAWEEKNPQSHPVQWSLFCHKYCIRQTPRSVHWKWACKESPCGRSLVG